MIKRLWNTHPVKTCKWIVPNFLEGFQKRDYPAFMNYNKEYYKEIINERNRHAYNHWLWLHHIENNRLLKQVKDRRLLFKKRRRLRKLR